MNPSPLLFLGLISGTSADGIDAALVRFADEGEHAHCELVAGRTVPWDGALRARLVHLGQGGDCGSLDDFGALDAQVARAFADAAMTLLDAAGIAPGSVCAIGSHGQTVRHRPEATFPFTLQIGDGNVIAERTGITTVADFRRRDVAAGGHGAPLLPALHAALLRSLDESRAVLNLGGIANLTLLPRASQDSPGDVRGFDTGPANALMDAWCERHTGAASTPMAHSPRAAGSTRRCWRNCGPSLGSRSHRPKAPAANSSTWTGCRRAWVTRRGHRKTCRRRCSNSPPPPSPTHCAQHNRIPRGCSRAAAASTIRCCCSASPRACPAWWWNRPLSHGVDPDFVEAMGFAWLARQTLAARPGNLPSVTGARGPRVLGAIHPA